MVYRYAEGDLTRIPALAKEVIRLKPDVIVASDEFQISNPPIPNNGY
jgi:hypothetical protein